MKWLVRTFSEPWQIQRKLYIARQTPEGFEVVTNFTMEFSPAGAVPVDRPILSGFIYDDSDDVRQFLQACMDEAWSIGLKPKAFEEPTRELKAVRDHLQDMRQLAGVVKS